MNAEETQFLELAARIGHRLCRDAIWADNRCNWVGPAMEYMDGGWKAVHRAYGTDLYSGTMGMGAFLSQLYAQTKDPIVRTTAMGCFEQAIANAQQTTPEARIGYYTGWAGMVQTLEQCGPLLETDAFVKSAGRLLEDLHTCNLVKSGIDLLAGSAGAIPVLLSRKNGEAAACRATAIKIADHLVETACKTQRGWSWDTLHPGSQDASTHLTGLSHGTAGIASALLEVYEVTKEDRYREAAIHAFAYERGWFSPEYGNWPDLRNLKTNDNKAALYGSVAWCHGAPGIGLCRLRAYNLLQDETCRGEAEIAVTTTFNMINQSLQSGQSNFSLCHGIAGNAELLLTAGDTLNNEKWRMYGKEVGQAGLALYAGKSASWPCGLAGIGEVPGLMLGLAGIGYFYLRLANPLGVPSILLPVTLSAN